MKKLYILVLLGLLGGNFLFGKPGNFPVDYTPSAWVNDYADMLSPREENYLNQKLKNYQDTTSTQIIVVTLNKNLHKDQEINYMGATIGETWNIGQKGNDNGLVMVVYPDEREIAISTGYGMEEYIPDAIAKRIIEKEIKPNFQNENYAMGIDQSTDVIFSLLSGEFTAESYGNQSDIVAPFGSLLFFILLFVLLGRSRRGRSYGVGRNLPFWVAMGMLSSSRNTHSGSFGNFSSGGGSFGGFSGGGGSFGGGGASGGW